MGTGFSKKKKQAKLLQEQFTKMQTQAAQIEAMGTAGNGLVSLTLNGEGELKQVKIKPECVDPEDIEGLEDLIKAAHADACKKLHEQQKQNMPAMPQGLSGISPFGL